MATITLSVEIKYDSAELDARLENTKKSDAECLREIVSDRLQKLLHRTNWIMDIQVHTSECASHLPNSVHCDCKD